MSLLPSGFCYTPTALAVPEAGLPATRNAGQAILTRATNDHEAVASWLARYLDGSRHTLESYRREGERLLLWLAARQQTLRQMMVEDVIEYRAFLRDPLPRERWCLQVEPRFLDDGVTPNPSWKPVRTMSRFLRDGSPNPAWRPFVSGLSPAASAQAQKIVFGMLEFLASVGYLAANPMRAVRRRMPREKKEIERYFDQELWDWLMGFIERLPRSTRREEAHYQRIRFLVGILYLTGLRISEMSAAKTTDLEHRRGSWWLRVPLGKGAKDGKVPLPNDGLLLLRDYRQSIGREPWPHPDLSEPLVMDVTGKGRPLTARALHKIVTEFFEQAAKDASPEHAKVLRQASCHWLRHTDASHQISAGVPLIVVRDNLRHASVTTTEGYVHTNRDHQHQETQRHQLRRET
jgi:integrase/recombinase XerD